MPTTTIGGLSSSLAAGAADATADLLEIEDASIPESKKITALALVQAALRDGPLIAELDAGGNEISNVGIVDGRDLSVDGAKLDAIEAGADVTDAANVAAAGAVMADGSVTLAGNLTVAGGVTIDGRDVGADGAILDSIATAIVDGDFAGVLLGRLTRTGAGAYAVIRDNLGASDPPDETDDSSAGYEPGSLWLYPSNGFWICVDASVGAALWIPLLPPGDNAASIQHTGLAAAAGTGTSLARVDHVHSDAVLWPSSTASTAFSLSDADHGSIVRCTAATTVTVTVPTGLGPITVGLSQEGAGQIQVVGSGVTLQHGATFNPYTAEQYAIVFVSVTDVDTVAKVSGDMAPV